MAPRGESQDRTNTPDPVEKGFATINTLRYEPQASVSMSHGYNNNEKSLILFTARV